MPSSSPAPSSAKQPSTIAGAINYQTTASNQVNAELKTRITGDPTLYRDLTTTPALAWLQPGIGAGTMRITLPIVRESEPLAAGHLPHGYAEVLLDVERGVLNIALILAGPHPQHARRAAVGFHLLASSALAKSGQRFGYAAIAHVLGEQRGDYSRMIRGLRGCSLEKVLAWVDLWNEADALEPITMGIRISGIGSRY